MYLSTCLLWRVQVGGGINELLVDEKELRNVAIRWSLGWPFLLAYNVLLMLACAIFPPFKAWYVAKESKQLVRK